MNVESENILSAWHQAKNEECLYVVMVYEDTVMGKKAKGVFERIQEEFGGAMGFDFRLWRLEALSNPDFYMSSITAAANADVVVLAVRAPGFSKTLWEWLEVWAQEISDETALVILFENRCEWEHTEAVRERLQELAASRRISIFVETTEVNKWSSPVQENPLEEEIQIPAAHTT